MHMNQADQPTRPPRRPRRIRRAAFATAAAASLVGVGVAASPVEAEPGASGVDLAGRSFAVETVVTYSLIPDFPAGSESEACYTFVDEGEFLDSEFPVPGSPLPGTYVATQRQNKTTYVANVEDSLLSLEQWGTVRERNDGQVVLKANSDVSFLGTLFVQVRSKGHEVDSCD